GALEADAAGPRPGAPVAERATDQAADIGAAGVAVRRYHVGPQHVVGGADLPLADIVAAAQLARGRQRALGLHRLHALAAIDEGETARPVHIDLDQRRRRRQPLAGPPVLAAGLHHRDRAEAACADRHVGGLGLGQDNGGRGEQAGGEGGSENGTGHGGAPCGYGFLPSSNAARACQRTPCVSVPGHGVAALALGSPGAGPIIGQWKSSPTILNTASSSRVISRSPPWVRPPPGWKSRSRTCCAQRAWPWSMRRSPPGPPAAAATFRCGSASAPTRAKSTTARTPRCASIQR